MNRIYHDEPETKPEKEGRGAGGCLPAVLLALLLAGCAPLMQGLAGGEGARKFQEAGAAFEQGKYREARDAYRALGADRSNRRRAERAQFNAAYILVYYRNPDKDYPRATREFEEFLIRYPASMLAGEANSWLDMLRKFDESRMSELLNEIDSLSGKMDELKKKLLEVQADKETAVKERDVLFIEKTDLMKRIGDLLNDKDGLLKEKAVLLKERDGLARNKIALERKVDILTRDKESLIRAKEKLEKSLHDLTMVDVKMEKKRKKVK